MEINIIDACKIMYGQKTPKKWPGTFVTNLNEFANACYGSCARFNNLQSAQQVADTSCGRECQYAMKQQLQLNGKTPCANWLPVPIISPPPQVSFIKEYIALAGKGTKSWRECKK